MKNKKLILGASIILGGGLFAYFFLRKKPTSLSDIKPELKTANNSPIQKDVLETSVVAKDTTKDEFNMYYKTYRNIKQQIIQKDKPIEVSPIFRGSNRESIIKSKKAQRDRELQSLRNDLLDYEQKIIDLGYTPTGRGTFVKTGAGVTNSVKTGGFFRR